MIKKVYIPEELYGQGGVITRGMDNTLLLFSIEEWFKFQAALDSLDIEDRTKRSVLRFFSGPSRPFDPEDRHIDLPEDLQRHITNGDDSADGYTITYGDGPFGTQCWKYSKKVKVNVENSPMSSTSD